MTPTTRNTLIAIVALIIIAVLAYFAWQERASVGSSPMSTSTTATTSTGTGVVTLNPNTATSTGTYTVTPVTVTQTSSAPNHKTPLTYSAAVSASDKQQDESQFATIQTTLASSPTDWNSWIALGALRMTTGDYQGAATDWKYVTQIYPNDPTAFANLGNLYATYLKQPSIAIANYQEAIKLEPTKEESFYQNLAQVYLNQGDKANARLVLQQGINAQVVGYQNLQTMLSSIQS